MATNTTTNQSSPPITPSFSSDAGANLFVGGVWALMLLGLLAYIWHYSSNVPGWDEWYVVPVLVGEQPLTLEWLWSLSPDNDHRIPLTRLTLLAIAKLSGGDFRAGLYVNAAALGALAGVLILAARRLRGWISYSDAFFPLLLLHVGHEEVLLQALEIAFTTTTILACAVLLLIVRSREGISLPAAVFVGTCLLLLPLNGAAGTALVPALAAWLAYGGVVQWRSAAANGRRNGLYMVSLAILPVLLVAFYVFGMKRSGDIPQLSPSVWTSLHGSAQFLTVGLGPAAQSVWPCSGYLVLGLLGFGIAVLVVVWLKQPAERFRALGFLFFVGSMTSLALAIGWGRSETYPDACFAPRYAILSLPLLCALYFIGGVYNSVVGGRLVQMGLFLFGCVLVTDNLERGLEFGRETLSVREALEEDILAGMPPSLLAEEYTHHLNPSFSGEVHEIEQEAVLNGLRMLHRARIGMFQHLKKDVAYRNIEIPVKPIDMNDMRWDEDKEVGFVLGNEPSLTFALPKPQRVYALRLEYVLHYGDADGDAVEAKISWKNKGAKDFPEDSTRPFHMITGEETKRATVWINAEIDQLRIHPGDKPCVLRISEIVLLIPATKK